MLCAAAAVFWVLSYFTYDVVGYWPSPAERRVYGLISTQGTVCLASLAEQSVGGRRWASRHDPDGSRRMELAGTAGFVLDSEPGGFIVGVPYWLACSLLASLPAFRWIQRRRREPTAGLCPACGYDLRATPDRCPECGADRLAVPH
jgi:hypothetical protein